MAWAHCGRDDLGRDIGYGVPAVCDHPSCGEEIDRGLAYVCGNMHGGDGVGCGRYFCEAHMVVMSVRGGVYHLCTECADFQVADEELD